MVTINRTLIINISNINRYVAIRLNASSLAMFSTVCTYRHIHKVEPITTDSSKPPTDRVPVYPVISKRIKYIDGKCVNAISLISNPQTLKMAYEMIKSNPGNMTKGSDNETLDGIDNA